MGHMGHTKTQKKHAIFCHIFHRVLQRVPSGRRTMLSMGQALPRSQMPVSFEVTTGVGNNKDVFRVLAETTWPVRIAGGRSSTGGGAVAEPGDGTRGVVSSF